MDCDKYEIAILPSAENDIRGIFEYIAVDLCDVKAAQELLDKITDGLQRIALFPYAMPKLGNKEFSDDKNFRRMDIGNFVIVYVIDENKKTIYIAAAFYAMSDFMFKLFKRI